jgi:hypothetical protein
MKIGRNQGLFQGCYKRRELIDIPNRRWGPVPVGSGPGRYGAVLARLV